MRMSPRLTAQQDRIDLKIMSLLTISCNDEDDEDPWGP
jgi:hypothetical protein